LTYEIYRQTRSWLGTFPKNSIGRNEMKKIISPLTCPMTTGTSQSGLGMSRILSACVVTACCLLLFFAVPAAALTVTVDDLESDLDDFVLDGNCETSEGACTLRAAMMEINGPLGGTNNTIQFDLLPGTHTLLLTNDLPIMYRNVDITGPGSDYGIIDGQGLYRIFSVQSPATFLFVGYFTLRNGSGTAGGALYASSGVTVSISKVVFRENQAINGGAVYCQGCEAFIVRCRFSGNQATQRGGALYVISGGNLNNMHDVLFEGNMADLSGGAIRSTGSNITMTNAVFEENSASAGGALDAGLNGGYFMKISDSSFRRNEAVNSNGGAINLLGTDGRAVFEGVTFSGNISGLLGGAVYASYGNSPHVTIANTSVTGNSAGLYGGGIHYQDQTSDIQLANVTVTGNSAGSLGGCLGGCGGGLYGLFSVRNSVIAGNVDLDPLTTPSPDCRGNFYSGGYNLIGDDSICSVIGGIGDQTGTALSPLDPQIGSLARNGGPTLTHALLSGSTAIDGGNPAGCYWDHDADRGASSPEVPLDMDQRTVSRPFNVVCDIGSYERMNCDDGMQNYGETGIDCGGSCAACSCPSADFAATNGTTFSTLQGAYDATWDGAEIKAREENTGEILAFDRPAHITLIGGHDCDFFRIKGMTTVASLTVLAGRLTVENIIVGP
jgi:predicted outer membrane repeat protein